MYVKENSDNSVEVSSDRQSLVGQRVSLPPDPSDDLLAQFKIFPVVFTRAFNADTEKLVQCAPIKVDGVYYSVTVEPKETVEVILSRLVMLAANYAAKSASGFTYNGNLYDIDDKAQSNMTSVQTAFLKGIANAHGGYWRSFDNRNIPMTDVEVQAFFDAAFTYKLTLIRAAQVAKDALYSSTTVEGALAIDVTLGA